MLNRTYLRTFCAEFGFVFELHFYPDNVFQWALRFLHATKFKKTTEVVIISIKTEHSLCSLFLNTHQEGQKALGTLRAPAFPTEFLVLGDGNFSLKDKYQAETIRTKQSELTWCGFYFL